MVTPGPEISLGIDETQKLTVIYYYNGSSEEVTDKITWSISDDDPYKDVLSIDENSVATGENPGKAQITASWEDLTSAPVLALVTTPRVPWSIIGGIIAAVLAASLLFFLLVRRRVQGGA